MFGGGRAMNLVVLNPPAWTPSWQPEKIFSGSSMYKQPKFMSSVYSYMLSTQLPLSFRRAAKVFSVPQNDKRPTGFLSNMLIAQLASFSLRPVFFVPLRTKFHRESLTLTDVNG